jgi:hypothetical protein
MDYLDLRLELERRDLDGFHWAYKSIDLRRTEKLNHPHE